MGWPRAVPRPGATLAGKYRIVRLLGAGTQGVVIEALHLRLGQHVALKFLHEAHLSNPSVVARFDREARNASSLRSPYAARVFDVDQTPDGAAFLVSELLVGRSLQAQVATSGPLSIADAVDCVRQASAAIAEAHERGIVHRDLKPANVFLADDDGVRIAKVLDFGISQNLARDPEIEASSAGALIGSPRCMSPEQVADPASVDARTDLWSLGAVLFFALTGRYPFEEPTERETIAAILGSPPRSLRDARPEVPGALAQEVDRALEKDPARRHADLRALARGLEPFGSARVGRELATSRYLSSQTVPPPAIAPRRARTHGGSSFFGREADLARLEGLIGEGRRVLTLVGPAGAGKTRLARRLAETVADTGELVGGTCFCDLTDARDLVGALAAISHALDVAVARATTNDQAAFELARAVAARGPTLLVIDNCEQVIDAAARIVARIAETAPHAILVVTSRESLRVVGEQVHMVTPLGVSSDGIAGSPSDAARLFVDRARGVWPSFAPTKADAPVLEEIVRRLDGLPLAIELAAARVGALSLETIRERLGERFALLAGGPRFASDRQRTMRGAIDWSWNLLSASEQTTLAECAIFRGGFSLGAAEHVVSVGPALDLLQSLTEKSLVASTDAPELGERRYRLFESVREYALEKLKSGGGQDAALTRHRGYFARAGAEWAVHSSRGTGPQPRARLGVELENLLAAHRHALGQPVAANDAFALLAAIGELLKKRGPLDLLLKVLDATLDDAIASRAEPSRVGQALRDRAYSRQFAPGAAAAKIADLTRAVALARATGDVPLELDCLSVFTSVELLNGDPQAARGHAKLSLARAKTHGDARAIAKACADLGSCALSFGQFEEARASFQEAIALTRKAEDLLGCALYLARLAEVSIELGRLDDANERAEEAIALCQPFGHHRLRASISGVQGAIEYERRNLPRARAHFDDALGFARQWGAELLEPVYRAMRAAVLADEDRIDDACADLDYAEAQLPRFADDVVLLLTVSVGRGHLDLAHARASTVAGDGNAAERHRVSAEKRLDGLRSFKHVFEDVRPMRRRLERELLRTTGAAATSLAAVATGDGGDRADALIVAEDGAWFRPPGGARVDLSQRPNLMKLLVSLTARRVGATGEPMSLDAVFRCGWPGDRANASSAANRVRVALARLRKLGLGDVLISRNGYLLDPDVPIVIGR